MQTTFAEMVARIANTWETVIIAETQDGSGMKVWLESLNHDSDTPQYRVRYGEDDENDVVFTSDSLLYAKKQYDEYTSGEVLGYFGLETL